MLRGEAFPLKANPNRPPKPDFPASQPSTHMHQPPLGTRLLLWYVRLFGRRIESLSPEAARRLTDRGFSFIENLLDFPPLKQHEVRDETAPARDGYPIPLRVYRPVAEPNLPLMVYFHGGGFVLRSIETHDRLCRRLAVVNRAVVVSVGYRLAPEHKFPVPLHDAFDALVWAAEQAPRWGARSERLVVAGDSAGGNLATVCCLLAREAGGPTLSAQVLIYPTTDATFSHPSVETFAEGYLLTKSMMQWFLEHYQRSPEDRTNPLFSPHFAPDLQGLPDALVLTAGLDPLRDEGAAYARKLAEAGVPTVYRHYPRMIHGFFNMPRLAPDALHAHEAIRRFLQAVFAKGTTLQPN
ncbi:MAG: alpha/beta hydrolase [Bacteroidetes bacterium]|nr:MAG: alpha/beta hydrolase [Bacteroidota bacterium]